jgi:hypothetical protein
MEMVDVQENIGPDMKKRILRLSNTEYDDEVDITHYQYLKWVHP